MFKAVFKKFWLFGLSVAAGLAILLSSIFTVWDWAENPGGIFRDIAGTNWRFVYETAASWFVPTFLYTLVTACALHIIIGRLIVLIRNRKHGASNADEGNETERE